ncbi:MAG: hypothetical protein GDA49_10670 [Rhodospirillales bacterium]|nr:hypothetical protein [Rhodospirillales bacterium]
MSATTTGDTLCDSFMSWQCLIRQHAMRRDGGRPSDGMEPLIVTAGGDELGHIRTVIAKREPEETTALFRHTVKRTNDPRERFEKGLQYLSSSYFQSSNGFEPRLFALFAPDSLGSSQLTRDGRCTLVFRQFSQSYRLPCRVSRLPDDDPFAEALFWHNAMFNPALPPDSQRLAFDPVWDEGTAFPPVDRG